MAGAIWRGLRSLSLWQFAWRAALLLLIWGGIVTAGVVAWFARDLPDVSGLYNIERRPAVTLLAADGSIIATFGDLYGEPQKLADLPRAVPQALLATEDRRFYHHYGVDPIGLSRAIFVNLRRGRAAQGGSTVTQQLAKNVFLTQERTFKRKVQEVLLAFWLEDKFTKDQILELYLNRVYFGAGAFGVEAASQRYFDKSARQLSVPEAAMLIGLLKAPSRYAPTADLSTAQNRARQVIANMQAAGYLDQAGAAAATARPARLARTRDPSRNARYFADWILDSLKDFIGSRTEDLVVQTTLDMRMQTVAEKVVEAALAKDGDRLDVEQGALVAMTPTGDVRAMVGGRDYHDSVFNRAVQARRQPGSSFKLFVYLAGLEAGIDLDDTFVDGPITVGKWSPKNYEAGYSGTVTLRDAVARSINTVAVQVSERVGRQRVIDAAHRLGITSDLQAVPAIALGASEVGLLEMTGAYAAVANGGDAVLPHGIIEVRTTRGEVMYHREGSGPGRVIGETTVAELNDLLSGVIDRGTGRAARLDRPAAGKTGTTNDSRDAWFIGFTPDLVTGVWIGNDDDSPMKRVTGGGMPAQIWRGFMTEALKGAPPKALMAREESTSGGGGGFGGFLERLIGQFGGNSSASSSGSGSSRLMNNHGVSTRFNGPSNDPSATPSGLSRSE